MFRNKATGTLWQIVCMCLALAFARQAVAEDPSAIIETGANDRLVLLLKSMPTNSDKRCVGIAGVAEALLDGNEVESNEAADSVDQLAQLIFEAFASGKAVSYPPQVKIDGRPQPITSAPALDQLVTAVADVYKSHHQRLAGSDEGIELLLAAEGSHVKDLAELDRALAADPDQLDFYCCFGRRQFPDGSVKQTSHAVLMRRNAEGPPTVFDPNDPGTPQKAKYIETQAALEVEWTCPYRDTGLVTTQRYQIVAKGRFFSLALDQAQDSKPAKEKGTSD